MLSRFLSLERDTVGSCMCGIIYITSPDSLYRAGRVARPQFLPRASIFAFYVTLDILGAFLTEFGNLSLYDHAISSQNRSQAKLCV